MLVVIRINLAIAQAQQYLKIIYSNNFNARFVFQANNKLNLCCWW